MQLPPISEKIRSLYHTWKLPIIMFLHFTQNALLKGVSSVIVNFVTSHQKLKYFILCCYMPLDFGSYKPYRVQVGMVGSMPV